jgi:hypothetical protein
MPLIEVTSRKVCARPQEASPQYHHDHQQRNDSKNTFPLDPALHQFFAHWSLFIVN